MIKPQNIIKRNWLRTLRIEKNLTIRGAAEIIGISHQHYGDIENGKRNPSFILSQKLAVYFNVPTEKFFETRAKFNKEVQE